MYVFQLVGMKYTMQMLHKAILDFQCAHVCYLVHGGAVVNL